jgi:TPR repeat protein
MKKIVSLYVLLCWLSLQSAPVEQVDSLTGSMIATDEQKASRMASLSSEKVVWWISLPHAAWFINKDGHYIINEEIRDYIIKNEDYIIKTGLGSPEFKYIKSLIIGANIDRYIGKYETDNEKFLAEHPQVSDHQKFLAENPRVLDHYRYQSDLSIVTERYRLFSDAYCNAIIGKSRSQYDLATYYLYNADIYDYSISYLKPNPNNFTGDSRTAELCLKWLKRSAEQNNLNALILLGEIYISGKITIKDEKLALKYLLKAAELDWRTAIDLANNLSKGKNGFSRNTDLAQKLYISLCTYPIYGFIKSKKESSLPKRDILLPTDLVPERDIFSEACKGYISLIQENNPVEALAWAYILKTKGEVDIDEIEQRLNAEKKSFGFGSTVKEKATKRALEISSEIDQVVGKNESEFLQLARKGKTLGFPEFKIYQLGLFYKTGAEGCPINDNLAFRCFLISSEFNFTKAYYNTGVCYLEGSGTTKDYKLAFEYFKKGAEKDDPLAQQNLAACYANGTGTEMNLVEAAAWWTVCQEEPNSPAKSSLATALKLLKSPEVEKVQIRTEEIKKSLTRQPEIVF